MRLPPYRTLDAMNARLLAAAGAALAAVALGATGCTGKNAVDQSGGQYRFVTGNELGTTYAAGGRKPAGNFVGTLLDGGALRLSEDAGKVVVINYWATWCGPCTTETPNFDKVYRAYQGKGVAVIGVDTKDSPSSKAATFVRLNAISFPIVYDESGQTALQLGRIPALSLPFTVLIDKHQRVAAVYLQPLAPKDLEPVLDKLLAET